MNTTEFEVVVDGLTWRGFQTGSPGGPPVLAIHGWLDNAASFLPLTTHRPELNWYCLDLLGHGLSDHRPPSSSYHFVDWAPGVMSVAESLGLDRYSLVAHSMGAGISPMIAGAFPEKVDRMLLVDGLGPIVAGDDEMPDRLATHVVRSKRARSLSIYEDIDSAAERYAAAVGGMGAESARLLLQRGMKPVTGGLTWRSDPRLRLPSMHRLNEAQVGAFLSRVKCPVTLVEAEQGLVTKYGGLAGRKALIKDLHVSPRTGGHHVHLECAAVVAEDLAALFER